MVNVFLTVDTEIWCNGWKNLDAEFPDAFRRYVYGPTKHGDYALPIQFEILRDHGLKAVFFVEPLFSARFGKEPLAEIVGLVNEAGQEIQLHAHTEWIDEARRDDLPRIDHKRQHLRYFAREEQAQIIAAGLRYLREAGAEKINAFRAGSFGFNADTLPALRANGVPFDSSYNPTQFGADSGVATGRVLRGPLTSEGITEYPMTCFDDGRGKLRHTQLGACSFQEMSNMLLQAAEKEYSSFVILSHNFEMLNSTKTRPDHIVTRRFRRLCEFLARHRDLFEVRGFHGLNPGANSPDKPLLHSNVLATGFRTAEQLWRRVYR
jgi:hypothetical protein